MRIVQLTPGSGETFYCENCLRDKELVRALRALGHDCLMVPLYLPIPLSPQEGPEAPIFYGGLNVYLQQKTRLFRRTPRWIDRLFDWRALLRAAGRLAGMTGPAGLGEATLSMLEGEEGRQSKELRRLGDWLAENHPPQVVCLSNALLAGLARGLRRRLGEGLAIACFLQDEDEFVDALGEPHRGRVWEKMAALAAEIDVFIAVSRHYAAFMADRLRLPPHKVRVVYAGLSPEDYPLADAPPERPVLGFLSPMVPSKGLDVLAEAFILLKRDSRLRGLRLRVAGGGAGAASRDYAAGVRARLVEAGVWGDAEFLGNPPPQERREFLRGLSVLSVPERRGEAAGLFLLEALACGVPVVQPRVGAAPELIEATGGGILVDRSDPAVLAEAIGGLLLDEPRRRELGARGRAAIAEKFTARRAAESLGAIFEGLALAPTGPRRRTPAG